MNKTSLKPEELSAKVEKSTAAAVEPVERTMERYLEVASVKSVYASPVKHGETMIIPAAEVLGALGFGLGAGMGVGALRLRLAAQPAAAEKRPAKAAAPFGPEFEATFAARLQERTRSTAP